MMHYLEILVKQDQEVSKETDQLHQKDLQEIEVFKEIQHLILQDIKDQQDQQDQEVSKEVDQ